MGKKTFAVSLDSVVYDRLLDFGCDLKLSSLSEMVNTALKRYFSAREEGKRFCHAALSKKRDKAARS